MTGAAGISTVVLWGGQWVIFSTHSYSELTRTGDWGSCLMKGRLEEGGEAHSAARTGLGAAAEERDSEEGPSGSESSESIFSSFRLITGASSLVPA